MNKLIKRGDGYVIQPPINGVQYSILPLSLPCQPTQWVLHKECTYRHHNSRTTSNVFRTPIGAWSEDPLAAQKWNSVEAARYFFLPTYAPHILEEATKEQNSAAQWDLWSQEILRKYGAINPPERTSQEAIEGIITRLRKQVTDLRDGLKSVRSSTRQLTNRVAENIRNEVDGYLNQQ